MSDRYRYTRARSVRFVKKTSGGSPAGERRRHESEGATGAERGGGSGRSPGRKRIFSIFQSHRGPSVKRKMHIFCSTSSVRQPHIDMLNDSNII